MAEVLVTPGIGVLVDDEAEVPKPILRAYVDEETGAISVDLPDESSEDYKSDDITVDQNAGRLKFVSNGTTFSVRELREDDGSWISRYKTLLPIFALEQLITQGAPVDPETTETLSAYSLDDSAYVLGLVYTNDLGRWSRLDGDWVLLAADDDSYDDMIVTPIDPNRAEEFIDLYDNNFVSVADLDQYEDSDSAVTEEPSKSEDAPVVKDDSEEEK